MQQTMQQPCGMTVSWLVWLLHQILGMSNVHNACKLFVLPVQHQSVVGEKCHMLQHTVMHCDGCCDASPCFFLVTIRPHAMLLVTADPPTLASAGCVTMLQLLGNNSREVAVPATCSPAMQ